MARVGVESIKKIVCMCSGKNVLELTRFKANLLRVKAVQSGLVNSLARGMVRSFTDLAAQHAVTRGSRLQTPPPPVPQGLPRFTSRGIAHPPTRLSHRIYSRKCLLSKGPDQQCWIIWSLERLPWRLHGKTSRAQWTICVTRKNFQYNNTLCSF